MRRLPGFTIIELLVVVAIIALLVSITLPVLSSYRKDTRYNACIQNMREIGVALTLYHQDYGSYPTAPRPDYLGYVGNGASNPAVMPFEHQTINFAPTTDANGNLLMGWEEWEKLNNFTGDTNNYTSPNYATWDYHWQEWLQPPVSKLSAPVAVGATSITVNSYGYTDNATGNFISYYSPPPSQASPYNTTSQCMLIQEGPYSDVEEITAAPTGNTLSIFPPLQHAYDTASTVQWGYQYIPLGDIPGAVTSISSVPQTVTLPSQNYGLATLYYLYLIDAKNYLRAPQAFHCPTLTDTEGIDRGADLALANSILNLSKDKTSPFTAAQIAAYSAPYDLLYRSFDPAWSSYNTYDATYNFDQYNNDIMLFDATLGYGAVNTTRQLHAPVPPADTVVCYCYGHAADAMPATVDFSTPALSIPPQNLLPPYSSVDTQVANMEKSIRQSVYLILWLDGTVLPVRPYLMQQSPSLALTTTPPNTLQYYWVPPYLYTQGDAHP